MEGKGSKGPKGKEKNPPFKMSAYGPACCRVLARRGVKTFSNKPMTASND